ncbi:hypothetical protein F4824DRAFT_463599 [Ustulina deusta]|nr:hypothetical protein F4824DRAFT_463599 [Ustulina deusta]
MHVWEQYGQSAVSIIPIGFAAPPKKRKKNRTKTRRSYIDSRAKGNAAGGASTAVETTANEGLKNLVAHESIEDHSDGESVAIATPISMGPVAPTHETQLFSEEISPSGSYTEATNASENSFSPGGRISPFTVLWDEDFNSDTSEHTMQPQIASAPQMNIDSDSIWTLVDHEKPGTLKLEEELMSTEMVTDFDPSTPTPFSLLDFTFGHSVASSPDTTFDFYPEVNIGLVPTAAKFPIDNWPVPNFPPVSTVPITTYSDSAQKQLTGLGPDFGPMAISGSNGNAATWIDIPSGPSCDQYQDHGSPIQSGTGQLLDDNWPGTFEYGPNVSTIIPSPQTASSGKGGRKRSSSADAEGGGDGPAQLVNCGRSPRETGGESLLACPFHKKDPQRYQDCGKYTLRRIKDVKQHIYRLHCKPELYCSRCFTTFKCLDERDYHIREGGCTKREVPSFDGTISEDQKKELKDCGGRGTSIQEQWTKLWEVIFPGTKPPRSPHIENDQATLLSCLRSYWDGNAGEIIERSLGEHDPESECLNSSQIKGVVDSILDHFGTNPTQWDLTSNRERADTFQQPLASEDFVGDMLNHSWPPREQSEIEFTSPMTESSADALPWCLVNGIQAEFLKWE